jgi:tyrosine-protein kinase Etk/Wzc
MQESFSIGVLLGIFVRRRRLVILGTLAVAILAIVVSLFFLQRKYVASASLLPDDQEASSPLSALLGQAGLPFGLAALGGGGGSAEIHREILGSYRVCQRVVEALDLCGAYDLDDARVEHPAAAEQAAVAKLQSNLSVNIDDRSGVLRVAVAAATPTLARDIVARFVDELDRFNQELVREAGRRKEHFLTERLGEANADLSKAQDAMKDFSAKEGVVHLPSELEAELSLVGELTRQLVFKELERASLAQDTAPDAPASRRLDAEIEVLRNQLDTLEHGGKTDSALRLKPLSELPALTLRYYELKRELSIQEEIANLLVQQLEQARLQAANTVPTLRVLDPAREPTLPAWPRKKLVVGGATLLGFMFFCLLALLLEFRERVLLNQGGRWQSWQWMPGAGRGPHS